MTTSEERREQQQARLEADVTFAAVAYVRARRAEPELRQEQDAMSRKLYGEDWEPHLWGILCERVDALWEWAGEGSHAVV